MLFAMCQEQAVYSAWIIQIKEGYEMKSLKSVLFVIMLLSVLLTGCVFNEDVKANEIGVMLVRNEIKEVLGAGIYTNWAWFADLKTASADTLTFSVEDPEVLTSKNQAVGAVITIQGRRRTDEASVRNIFTNWNSLLNNDNLIATVSATAREGLKNSVRAFTLTELLDDRNGLATKITEQLELDASKYSFEIINVTVENISVDPEYMEILNAKAVLSVETEKELERQKLIKQKAENDIMQAQFDVTVLNEQTKVQIAQTEFNLEIAAREGKMIEAINKVYMLNPQAFELEKLKLLKELFGVGTVYFIEKGTDLTTFFNSTGANILPVAP